MQALSVTKKLSYLHGRKHKDSEEGAPWKHFEDCGRRKATLSQPFILTEHGSVGVVFTA